MNVAPAYYHAGDAIWYWNPYPAPHAPTFFGPAFVARSAWECPRCKTMNAPHADRCDCKADGVGDADEYRVGGTD